MNVARPERPPQDAQASASEAHGEIRGKEVTSFRRQLESGGEVIASDAHSLVERVSTTSTNEIDKLIDQLRTLREFFQNEGQRIQREIDEYAHLGDAVLKSTKTMAANMAQLKYTGAQGEAERVAVVSSRTDHSGPGKRVFANAWLTSNTNPHNE